MKKAIQIGLVLGLVCTMIIASVPNTVWAPPLIKIGVVNWEQVILEYKIFQRELAELQKRRKKILDFINKEYDDVSKEEIRRRAKSKKVDRDLQNLYKDTLKQHRQRRKQTIQQYHQKINNAIREEAIEQGFSLILSENEILYAAEGYTDMTNSVIKRLNSSENNSE